MRTPNSQRPSRTATLYRVAYRRTNREPSKGYTYKVFKGEIQARAFMDRLMAPQDDSTPERFRTMAPLAEVYIHVGIIHWEALDDPKGTTNLVELADDDDAVTT